MCMHPGWVGGVADTNPAGPWSDRAARGERLLWESTADGGSRCLMARESGTLGWAFSRRDIKTPEVLGGAGLRHSLGKTLRGPLFKVPFVGCRN